MSTNEELVMLIQEGRTELLSELWDNTYKLLRMLTGRLYKAYAGCLIAAGADLDDFIQESYFALLDAVKAYKPDSKFKFNTYLKLSIRNRLRNLIGRKNDAALRSVSLDEPIGDEDSDGDTRMDMIRDEDVDVEGDVVEKGYTEQLHDDIEECLDLLPQIDKDVIVARFYKGQSLKAFAEANSITVHEATVIFRASMIRLRGGKTHMKLRPYRTYIIARYAFNSSFTAWRERQASSTELTALKLVDADF